MHRKTWFVGGTVFVLGLVVYLWLFRDGSGTDILAGVPAAGDRDPAVPSSAPGDAEARTAAPPTAMVLREEGPVFGQAYLDGRTAWLDRVFDEDARALAQVAPPTEPTVECRVHRDPFTDGPWVEGLPAEIAAQRLETEHHAVEGRMRCFLSGVSVREAALYLAASGFSTRLEGEGKIERELFLPPRRPAPSELRELPEPAANRWLVRERWSRALAKPTAVYYVHRLIRRGDLTLLRYDAWRNFGDSDHAAIRLASGQYVLAPRDRGTLLELHSYYSGQTIPALMDGFVASMTEGFYAKLARFAMKEAPIWVAPAEVEVWAQGLGFGPSRK